MGTGSGRCVDITGFNTDDGTRLQLYDCHRQLEPEVELHEQHPGQPAERQVPQRQRRRHRQRHRGEPVDVQRQRRAAVAVQSNGNIVNTQSGRCLDAVGRGTANGTQLQIYDCVAGGQSNQQWSLR